MQLGKCAGYRFAIDGSARHEERLEQVRVPPVVAVDTHERLQQSRRRTVQPLQRPSQGAVGLVPGWVTHVLGERRERDHRGMGLVHGVGEDPDGLPRQIGRPPDDGTQEQSPPREVVDRIVVPHEGWAPHQRSPRRRMFGRDGHRCDILPRPEYRHLARHPCAESFEVGPIPPCPGVGRGRDAQCCTRRVQVVTGCDDQRRVRLCEICVPPSILIVTQHIRHIVDEQRKVAHPNGCELVELAEQLASIGGVAVDHAATRADGVHELHAVLARRGHEGAKALKAIGWIRLAPSRAMVGIVFWGVVVVAEADRSHEPHHVETILVGPRRAVESLDHSRVFERCPRLGVTVAARECRGEDDRAEPTHAVNIGPRDRTR